VLPEGLLAPRVALIAAVALAGVALLAAAALGVAGRPLAIPIVLLALILSAGYSAPPLRLHSSGLGEATVALIVPGLTPLLGYHLQTGTLDGLPLLATAPLMLLQGAMALTIHFPDAEADARVGKRTLVVRLGSASARLHNAAIVAAYAILPLVVLGGLPPVVAAAAAATAPLAAWQIARVHRGAWNTSSAQDSLAFGGIALLMTAGVAETLAFLALAGR
jgi:1,4-dihydroxy-2-naphthoate octaprenyltransferase